MSVLLNISNLQFALLIKVKDSFFEVVHLTEHQSLIEHSVVAPQERNSFYLQHLLSLTNKSRSNTVSLYGHFCFALAKFNISAR